MDKRKPPKFNPKKTLDSYEQGETDKRAGLPPRPPRHNPQRQAYINGYNQAPSRKSLESRTAIEAMLQGSSEYCDWLLTRAPFNELQDQRQAKQ